MRPLDWIVLCVTLLSIIAYGQWRSRGNKTTAEYLLAGKTMPWYAMGLSIMATQASAITFISTTGQAYVDGMRFVQYYFGLPVAMTILCATAVPIFHRTRVYTAYEYLEQRFDAKTRALVSGIFLIQRGLGVGVALYAPAVVLSVILGWPDRVTTMVMGAVVIAYTVKGGIKAVTWTDVQQMLIIFFGLIVALCTAVHKATISPKKMIVALCTAVLLLPAHVSFLDAVSLAGAAGRLNAVTTKFDLNDRFNIWSGLIGGTFLALAYFGTDQSQVQRYLTGRSIAQSRLSLLFNAIAKVPMQFTILFIGAMVFVFFLFVQPPLLFHKVELQRIQSLGQPYKVVEARYNASFTARKDAAGRFVEARRRHDTAAENASVRDYRAAQKGLDAARADAAKLVGKAGGERGFNDTNYIFLSFVTQYMPAGIVGLVMAAIVAAAMSASSGEVNSLATVTVIDIYKRHVRKGADDREYLWASRIATLFWGCYAVAFAQYGAKLGSLIVAVNMVGSLFYGSMLGVFVLAFFFRRVRGTAAFFGVLAGEAAILSAAHFTNISFLWYNVVGCVVVVATAVGLTWFTPPPRVAAVPAA